MEKLRKSRYWLVSNAKQPLPNTRPFAHRTFPQLGGDWVVRIPETVWQLIASGPNDLSRLALKRTRPLACFPRVVSLIMPLPGASQSMDIAHPQTELGLLRFASLCNVITSYRLDS